MSMAEPLLPTPDADAEPRSGVLPDDDALAGDVEDDTDRDGGRQDPAGDGPTRFVTPQPGDRLSTEALRQELGGE